MLRRQKWAEASERSDNFDIKVAVHANMDERLRKVCTLRGILRLVSFFVLRRKAKALFTSLFGTAQASKGAGKA